MYFFCEGAKALRQAANPQPSVTGEIIRHESGKAISDHAHREGQLSIVLAGTVKIASQDGWWLAPAGRGVWIPSDVRHSARYSEAATFLLLKISSTSGGLPAKPRTIGVSPLLKELALEICREKGAPGDAHLLSELIISQISRSGEASALFLPSGRDPRLVRLMEDLREDPGQDTPLNVLARRAASSRRTLSRLFQTEVGMSFAQWRDHLRIVTALDMLMRGATIPQIALEVGYQSQSSFTTMFTRIIGKSPGRYLREVVKKDGYGDVSTLLKPGSPTALEAH